MVNTASTPIKVVAMVNINQASTPTRVSDDAIAQCPTVLAVAASGKLKTQNDIVNGRCKYSGRMNSWMSAIIASTAARPIPAVLIRLPVKANNATLAVAGGTINVTSVGKRASVRGCSVISRPT